MSFFVVVIHDTSYTIGCCNIVRSLWSKGQLVSTSATEFSQQDLGDKESNSVVIMFVNLIGEPVTVSRTIWSLPLSMLPHTIHATLEMNSLKHNLHAITTPLFFTSVLCSIMGLSSGFHISSPTRWTRLSELSMIIPIRSGSIVALVTPMTITNEIDYEKLISLLQWHVAEGGRFCLCTTTCYIVDSVNSAILHHLLSN